MILIVRRDSEVPKKIRQINIFVSCPGDVEKEKQAVRDACDILTKISDPNIQVKVIDWRKDVVPLVTGGGAQSVINDQIREDYDIYVGIFWKRFGDKQLNGLTPTEEEFEKAFDLYKKTGKPLITVYFKTDNIRYPNSVFEAEQLVEVQKFKQRVKQLGLYGEFKEEEFSKKIIIDIGCKITKISTLTSFNVPVSKKKYPKVSNYLSRKVYSKKDFGSIRFSFLRSEFSQDILGVIEQNNRIVLLSDAGVGKTTELERIAWHFSQDNSPFNPFFIPLNKYVDQSISELLPQDWKEIPESQLLIILDGVDEIESKNKNDAIRQIELFSEQYPKSIIIVSCRTNFYESATKESPGTLSGFSSYVLHDLDNTEINKYQETNLRKPQRVSFIKRIYDNQLQDLLGIPFYLIRLVELYKTNNDLPKNRAQIFEQLLISRIKLDVEHFRTTIELRENRNRIIETLELLALGMETLGRNYITDSEYHKLVPDESLQTLIKHCTVWKRVEGDSATWQFEHNTFQEYLAARLLSRKPFQMIKDFISFRPDHRKVIPSWISTLSFLLNISDDRELYHWILENGPELALNFEHDRIENTIRIRIFKEIFTKYKLKQIWIPRDKINYSELARFGESKEIIDFLLIEIKTETHYTTLCNAIELLRYMEIPLSLRQSVSDLLVRTALNRNNDEKSEMVQNHALIALARLKLNSKEVVSQIVPVLHSSNSDWVRYGLYYFLHNSDYLDENIWIFLEGIKYVRSLYSVNTKETRLGNEHWHLSKGLEKVKSPDAITEIFKYFIENPGDLHDAFFEKSITFIVENAASALSEERALFELAMDLLTVLVSKYLEKEAKLFVHFFDKTNTRFQAFQKIFEQKGGNEYSLDILAILADRKCIEFLVQQYEEGKVEDHDVWVLQNFLGLRNPDLYLPFNELVNEKSGNKFILPPKRDLDKEREQRKQHDINLLFNKQAFMNEVKLIFDTEQKQTFTSKELLNVKTQHWDNPYFSDLVIFTLHKIAKNQPISLETATQILDSNWNWFRISKMYEYLKNDENLEISMEQKDWISEWCYTNLDKVNFRTALVTKPDRKSSASWIAIFLWYFLRKFDLTYPKDILLDMLSFDWIEGTQMLGMKYLEDRLEKDEITARILENLETDIQNNDILKNHIDYCKRNKIYEVLPFALREIPNADRDYQLRSVALDTVCDLSETLSYLEQLLPKITDDFKWDVVEQLVKRKSAYTKNFLVELLVRGNEQEQLEAATHLIGLQNMEGLRHYVEWIKKHKRVPEGRFEKSPISTLQVLEAVPFLIELLKLTYQKDFVKDDFPSLYNIIVNTLTTIAIQSDQNYVEVKKVIENFINENSSIIDGVTFLNVFLESLEQKYYVIKSVKLDINDVIEKIENMYSH